MTLHEALGKILASLQYGTCFAGTDNRNFLQFGVVLEVVIDTLHQWVLGTYHYHLNTVSQHKDLNSIEVVSLYVYVLANCCCTGIPRGNIQFPAFLTLSNLPS